MCLSLGLLDVNARAIQANEVGDWHRFQAHALSTLGRKPRRRVTLCLSLGLLDVSTQTIQANEVGGLASVSSACTEHFGQHVIRDA